MTRKVFIERLHGIGIDAGSKKQVDAGEANYAVVHCKKPAGARSNNEGNWFQSTGPHFEVKVGYFYRNRKHEVVMREKLQAEFGAECQIAERDDWRPWPKDSDYVFEVHPS